MLHCQERLVSTSTNAVTGRGRFALIQPPGARVREAVGLADTISRLRASRTVHSCLYFFGSAAVISRDGSAGRRIHVLSTYSNPEANVTNPIVDAQLNNEPCSLWRQDTEADCASSQQGLAGQVARVQGAHKRGRPELNGGSGGGCSSEVRGRGLLEPGRFNMCALHAECVRCLVSHGVSTSVHLLAAVKQVVR
eukprot:6174632-Pleurochrysis_carterae.AAC.2